MLDKIFYALVTAKLKGGDILIAQRFGEPGLIKTFYIKLLAALLIVIVHRRPLIEQAAQHTDFQPLSPFYFEEFFLHFI